jgi:starvation-inducible DNA-binding protein
MQAKNKAVTAKLYEVLVNSYALYLKLQNYHWNVEGENFGVLHEMFGNQYEELSEAIDEIAERIRALGEKVPASFKIFAQQQSLTDALENNSWRQMVKDLHESHLSLCNIINDAMKIAAECNDEGTLDMMINRLKSHEKSAWMLRVTLSE